MLAIALVILGFPGLVVYYLAPPCALVSLGNTQTCLSFQHLSENVSLLQQNVDKAMVLILKLKNPTHY